MATVSFEVVGDTALLNNLDRCRDAYDKAMKDCALDLKARIIKEIGQPSPGHPEGSNDTGRLHSPGTWEIKEGVEKFSKIIYPTVDYAEYVHEGTGPARGRAQYWPRMSALEPWCRNHGIDNVFLVARKIHDVGIQPNKFVDRAMDSVGDSYSKFMDNALKAAGVVL